MVTRNCNWCNKEYQTKSSYIKRGQGLYCTRSCGAFATNKKRKPTGVMVCCATCDKIIYRIKRDIKNTKTGRFYCNRECKKISEKTGIQRKKKTGNQRRLHLEAKARLIEEFGIKCQAESCEIDLKGDRKLIDMHHLDDPLDHENTVLLCSYHHRLIDNGYVFQRKGALC